MRIRPGGSRMTFDVVGVEIFQQEVLATLTGMNEEVKARFTQKMASAIIAEAKRNIRRNNRPTRYPMTGNLARSLRYEVTVQGFDILAGGEDVPYARLMDEPKGTYERIWSNTKSLNFYWYRHGLDMSKKSINKPGTGFLSEAIDTVASSSKMDVIFGDVIDDVNKGMATQGRTIKLDDSGAGKYRLGSLSHTKAQRMGLVKQTGSGYALTKAGKQYVNLTPSQKRAFRKIAKGKL